MTFPSPSFSSTREVADEFDRWAQAGRGDRMADGHRHATQALVDDLAIDADSAVLDAGCGIGWVLNDLLGARISSGVGIDIAPEMVAIAESRRTLPHLKFAVADSANTPFDPETFSHVISIESVYYTPDPQKTIAEWLRIARPGGRLGLVIDLHRDNPAASHWVEALSLTAHNLSVAEWRDVLESAGWREVESHRVPLPVHTTPEAFAPSPYFPSYDIYRGYCEAGSLLLWTRKPQ